ncbi:MAG: hypothetical protein M3071_08765 [Actinomycetota bacterium]|nr:hypothetical protein [Actinomycetota bacterium]
MRALDHGRWAFGLTALAFVWAIGLIAAALVVPVYSSETVSAPGGASPASASATLVGVNGMHVLIPVAVPAVVAAIVAAALHRKCTHGGRASGYLAWSLISILCAVCLVAMASIGLFTVPVPGLLAAAATRTPSGAEAASIRSPP